MNAYGTFDEFHLTFLVPIDFEDGASEAIKNVLESRSFRWELRQAIRQVLRQYPELDPVRVRISV
ncbi:MAG: hypothetical protein ACYC3I_27715 [Gemmataceae bacterium]